MKTWNELNALEREQIATVIARTDDGNDVMGRVTFPGLGLIWDGIREWLRGPQPPWELEHRKPTITELENLLHSEIYSAIEIQPDGSIRAVPLPDATETSP